MANYNPPIENLPIFDTLVFTNGDTTITQNQADKRYLRFPVAQGLENFTDIIVYGNSTFNTGTFNGNIQFNNPNGQSSVNSILIRDPTTSRAIGINTNSNDNTGDNIVNAGDAYIGCNGDWCLSNFSSTSSKTNGIRLGTSSLLIGYGGTTDIPTNNITFTETATTIGTNGLTYSNATVQNSAFTGGTAGTYTNTNMTIDANGKISAISSGIVPTIPFAPKFANYSNYQSISGIGYSSGTKINWAGSWGNLDYVMLRITAQGNWGNSGSGWQNYATTCGQLILRPHYAPSGIWANTTTTMARYSTNSNNANIGFVGKTIYYTGAINNGTQDFFYIYGTANSIEFNFNSPSIVGGWEYTHLIEYICHSTSGGTITITNGTGTNNSLP